MIAPLELKCCKRSLDRQGSNNSLSLKNTVIYNNSPMDNRGDNFASGFLAGAFCGSVVGGILGALLASKIPPGDDQASINGNVMEGSVIRRKRQLNAAAELNIEGARQSLEGKIAQLNDAIDDVRRQLNNVNGDVQELED
ncbi:MAG TPA: hypothetical protein V6D03_05520 [Candidatus Caenarcaniphilales bacterium]